MKSERPAKKSSSMATFFSTFGTILLVIVILMCLPITVPRLFGFQIYSVISGSMEPAIPTGSLVYTKTVAPETIKSGEVIAFFSATESGSIITHRVVENHVVAGEFITKGDANPEQDMEPVGYDYLIGKVEAAIPYLGKYLSAVATSYGKISTACLIALSIVLLAIAGVLRKGRK